MRIVRDYVQTLPLSASVYVPSTINGNVVSPAIATEMLNHVMARMIDLHGGCTVTTALGGYRMENGQIVSEQIHIVTSAATNIDEQAIFDLAIELCEKMTQECVGVILDGQFNLVSSPKRIAA